MPNLQHPPFLIQEQHVDCKLHPDGVDRFARRNPEPFARFKTGVLEKSCLALLAGVGDVGAIGKLFVSGLISYSKFRQ